MKKLLLVVVLVIAMVTPTLAQKCVAVRNTMAYEDHEVIEQYVTALLLSANAGNTGFFKDVHAEFMEEGLIVPVNRGDRLDIIRLDKIIITGQESTIAQVKIGGRLLWINTVELDCKRLLLMQGGLF